MGADPVAVVPPTIPPKRNMRVPVRSAHGLHQDKFGSLRSFKSEQKLHTGKPSHETNMAQVGSSIGAGPKARQPASRRSHPAAKTGVAKCAARSRGAASPHRQLLLPTATNWPNASDVITISDDSADEGGPDDLELGSESVDHPGVVNCDGKVNYQDGKRSTSSKSLPCVICSHVVPQEGRHYRGSKKHFYCLDCLRNLVTFTFNEGSATIRCRTGLDICSAPFLASQLHFLQSQPDKPGDESRLEQITIDEIQREAELVIKNDAHCPFCPWSELYPDIEKEPVFRCRNPICRVSSCRRCSRQEHPGHGCNEATALSLSESKAKVFSLFSEALSAAVIRKGNKCQTKFTLGEACNKITCCKCQNKQCYVCHKDLEGAIHDAGYRHFAKRREIGKCPLYKNTALLHCENKGESLPTIAKKTSTEFPDLAPLVPVLDQFPTA